MPASAQVPRLGKISRLFLEARLLLTAVSLLLLPQERITIAVLAIVLSFALLTWMTIHYWGRFLPYLAKHPLLVSCDALVAASLLAMDGPNGPLFIATVFTTLIVGIILSRIELALFILIQVLCYTIASILYATMEGTADALLNFQVLVTQPLMYIAAGYFGLKLRNILAELDYEQIARQDAERKAVAAEERARLARDMHDSVSKTLQGTAMAAQALPLWIDRDPDRAVATAYEIARASQTAALEARELISELRRPENGQKITEVIKNVGNSWSAESGVSVEVTVTQHDVPLMVAARTELIAVLHEALTNINRHAAATWAHISLRTTGTHAELVIKDNGKGFDPQHLPKGHYGVLGMHERAAHAGGSLDVKSGNGKGTHISLLLPLARAAVDAPISSPGLAETP